MNPLNNDNLCALLVATAEKYHEACRTAESAEDASKLYEAARAQAASDSCHWWGMVLWLKTELTRSGMAEKEVQAMIDNTRKCLEACCAPR